MPTAHTGSLVFPPNLSMIGTPQLILGKVTFAEALDTTETITIAVKTGGVPLIPLSFSVSGKAMDAHATAKTLAVKWGTAADDDGFQLDTVYNILGLLMPEVNAPGALIGTKINLISILGTVTADPATDVGSGDWYIKMWVIPVNAA